MPLRLRITAILMALLMGVPMCLCCVASASEAGSGVAAGSCAACVHETAAPASASFHRECPCVSALIERDFAPQLATAPRPVLVDFVTPVWQRAEGALYLSGFHSTGSSARLAELQDMAAAEVLYLQHCSLRI